MNANEKKADVELAISRLLEASLQALPYKPTEAQGELLRLLCRFAVNHQPGQVFVLNGYAGTGKTSTVGALVKGMKRLRAPFVLLSPTGRAAKVASQFSGVKASTIHKRLFRPMSASPMDNRYFLARNEERDTLFLVDEASMITHSKEGRGSLLMQLTQYVYSGDNCAMVLIGDTAQLPPIGEQTSPAMDPETLRSIGLSPFLFTLTEPMRQAGGSGILANATAVRRLLGTDGPRRLSIKVKGFDDVRMVGNGELADELASSWAAVGQEETLIITRSNWRANACNLDVRNRVLYADEPLMRGERIVIAKNDYYWGKVNKSRDFVANGETAVVEWVGSSESRYGFTFVDVELRLPSDGALIGCKLIVESLLADGPGLTRAELEKLYRAVAADTRDAGAEAGSSSGSKVDKRSEGDETCEGESSLQSDFRVQQNPYFNAVQAKYAYCVTCHKSQGGQWRHVYIDLNSITPEALSQPDFYRWLYTAITRATERLYFIANR